MKFFYLKPLLFGLFLSQFAFTAPPILISVEEVSAPRGLYHWATLSHLQKWERAILASRAQGGEAFPLYSRVRGTRMGGYLHNSFTDASTVLFAWTHPIGGMTNTHALYPENLLVADAHEEFFAASGMIDTPENRESLVGLNMNITAGPTAVKNNFLVAVDLAPSAKAIKVVVTPRSGFSEQNVVEELIPELKRADLLHFVLQNQEGIVVHQEWALLNGRAVTGLDANPVRLYEILEYELARLKDGVRIPAAELHIAHSYLNEPEGRYDAIALLSRLVERRKSEARRVPALFGGTFQRAYVSPIARRFLNFCAQTLLGRRP